MEAKKCWIGGNFKSAASRAVVTAQVKVLNDAGAFPANAEVVIAPSALHIGAVVDAVRADVGVAIQDIHTAKVRREASVGARGEKAAGRARAARSRMLSPSFSPSGLWRLHGLAHDRRRVRLWAKVGARGAL